MAYSDSKHDDNMEAGLLSNHQEERMSKEDPFQDSEFPAPNTNTRGTSAARRVFMAFGICFLLAIGLVSIGSATGMCPGHLRSGDLSVKDAVHRHNPNLSHIMGHMDRRQNTPIPGSSTTEATQPSATSESSSNNDASSTSQPAASTTQDNQPTTTAPSESSSEQPSQTQETSEADSTTDSGTSTAGETTASETSSSPSESSESIASASTSASKGQTTTKATKSTITTGTRTTSSAVVKALTSTLSNGGVTTLTSTSWVAVVPASETTSASNPNLQNAAPQTSVHGVLMAAIGMVFGGLMML